MKKAYILAISLLLPCAASAMKNELSIEKSFLDKVANSYCFKTKEGVYGLLNNDINFTKLAIELYDFK